MKDKNLNIPILIVSIAIPAVVALLLFIPKNNVDVGFNVSVMPLFHAVINSITALLLVLSLYFIKNKQVTYHMRTNWVAISLSALFLLSYVTYHYLAPSTKYGDYNHDGSLDTVEIMATGGTRYVYYFILLTHILFAIAVVPMVLYTLLRAYQGDFEKHKKIARITWPIWFYVAVTGVVVYLMISPFY